MGGGGDTEVKYYQSPEQRSIMSALLPMANILGQAGKTGEGLYSIPTSPTYGTLPTPGNYASAIADPTMMMPTGDWYSEIAPEVTKGLWAPYEKAGTQLWDVMQSKGQLGSQRGGVSAGAGAALGELYAQGAKDVGLSAYQMMQQPMQQYWSALTTAQQLPLQQQYAAELGKVGAEYGQAQNAWQAQLQSQMMPWQIMPSMVGGAYPEGIAQEGSKGFDFGGAAMGGGLMGLLAASNPVTAPYALALGGLGAFGGGSGGK